MSNKGFIYKDGGEENLLKIVSSESFYEGETWLQYTDNWPLLYHLSPLRKNLLDWYPFGDESIKILELGAGCGAITSYLITLPNVEKITAVEGSSLRSEIIKKRCKNANNIEVINENISSFHTDEKYDYVIVIGVLEYSGKYINEENPYSYFLNYSHTFLNENGKLILAIENQLGHKYLVGCNEDHYGRPYQGLSNYPNDLGIRTFSKAHLKELLNLSGFNFQKWYYPFPDYKLPNLLLSDKAFITEGFDYLTLLDTPSTDYSFNDKFQINEKELLKLLSANVDVSVFMNSFLIICSSMPFSIENDILGIKTSHTRFHNKSKKVFEKVPEIRVKSISQNGETITYQKYYKGNLNLFDLIIDSLWINDEKNAVRYINIWIDELKKVAIHFSEEALDEFIKFQNDHLSGEKIYINSSEEWVSSEFLDLIPNNILINKDYTETKIIDQEWNLPCKAIPIQLVVDRGVYYILFKLKKLNKIENIINNSQWNLKLSHKNNYLEHPDIESLLIFEKWFQNYVYLDEKELNLEIKKSENIEFNLKAYLRKRLKTVYRKIFK